MQTFLVVELFLVGELPKIWPIWTLHDGNFHYDLERNNKNNEEKD